MGDFVFRQATIDDVPFLVQTIVEAEKSGTEKLSYSTIFDLKPKEVEEYLTIMLKEEIDGCELSISSFLIAELDGNTAASLSGWIEGESGTPSSVLKGNLLSYSLPARCIEKARKINNIIREIHIEYLPGTIQIGAGYVAPEFRGQKLLRLLTDETIARLCSTSPKLREAWAQIFDCNKPSIRTYENAGFIEVMRKVTSNIEIFNYLPSNNKILMKKNIY